MVQGGNVWECNEAILLGSRRGARSGCFSDDIPSIDYLHASYRGMESPALDNYKFGIRVAEVPEPATLALARYRRALGAYARRKERNKR